MKWTHLPEAGGIYDQHPLLIERFYAIMAEVSAEQERENKKKQRNMGAGATPRPSMGGRGRRR